MDMILFKKQGFHRKFFIEVIFLCLSLDFIIKCALNVRNRAKICVEQKGRPFEQLIKFITVFPVISVMKWLL